MTIRGQGFQVPEAKLGAFTLDQPVLDLMSNEEALTLRPDQIGAIRAAYSGSKPAKVVDGRIYLGYNATSPQIGDYRISYELVRSARPASSASRRGRASPATRTVAGDELLMVDAGSVSAEKMFEEAKTANTVITMDPARRRTGAAVRRLCDAPVLDGRARRRHPLRRQHRQLWHGG